MLVGCVPWRQARVHGWRTHDGRRYIGVHSVRACVSPKEGGDRCGTGCARTLGHVTSFDGRQGSLKEQ